PKMKLDDPQIEKYVAIMRGWDGKLSRESQAAVLYAYWLPLLQDAVYSQQVPKELVKEVAAKSGLPTLLHALENPNATWFGNQPEVALAFTLSSSFEKAVLAAKNRFPKIDDMRWGKLHTVTFRHPLASVSPFYEK